MQQTSISRVNLASWCYLILILAYLIFIMVASFYDTGVTSRRLSLFWNLARMRPSFHNIRDITTNILLYMPLGFFVGAGRACATNKSAFSLPLLLAGFVLSFMVETYQAKVGRYSDIVDVLSNGVGYCLGYLVLYSSVKIYHFQPAALLGLHNNVRSDSTQTLLAVRLIYLLIVSFVALLPLDITVEFSTLLAKLTPAFPGMKPAILLDPLFHFHATVFEFHDLVLQLLALVPLGLLSALIMQRRGTKSSFAPALDCLLFAVALEIAKIFVRSAESDVLIIIMAPLVGLLCGLGVNNFTGDSMPSQAGLAAADFRQRKMFFALLSYGLFLVLWNLSPYDFELRASALIDKLRESNFIPFALHFSERSVSSAIDIAREFLLFVPFGLLSFPLLYAMLNRKIWVILACNFVFIAGSALTVEILQLLVIGRYVDITDVLLATAGGLAGILLQPKFLPRLRPDVIAETTE